MAARHVCEASKQSGIIPTSMALLPQDTFADDYVVTVPIHSRLPRLDLGIDWVPRWEEFRTSLRGAVTGPRVEGDEAVSGGEDLRVEWIRGYRPRSAFLAAILCHVAAIWLIILPIWGFLPQTQAAVPMQLNVQWDLSDLPAISLPARAAKKSVARSRSDAAKKNQQRGADAYNPRQTILSTPVKLTHPRQTLIEPDAPMKAPTIVQQLPNIVQWSVPQVQRPTIEYSTSQSKPELRQTRRRLAGAPQIASSAKVAETLNIAEPNDMRLAPPAPVVSKAVIAPRRTMRHNTVAAPQVAETTNIATLLNVAETNDMNLAPPAPVPSNSAVMARHRAMRQATEAPEISDQENGSPADVRKMIALSAAPAPPAPEVQIPKGNLAANVAISLDGKKTGSPGGAEGGGADSKSAAASPNGGVLPAAISVSGSSSKAPTGNNVARQRNIASYLNLSMRPMIYPGATTPHSTRTGPANVAALPPGAPPEELLSGKVFSMRVSTPNTTSTLGSWTLSFAQLGGDYGAASDALSGPEPIYTVDPKYPPDTMLEHISGEVVLYAIIRKDGSVDSIQLVHGLDARLDRSAMDALAQWKFRPGSRAGKPVDLEAVIHVPFEYRKLRY
ncbi:MAG TPA: energy transducer TonB [Candidatus Acidoferrales bacterium]|nr:energy transducer TonB [Candidatus Acidoferrales bacterium]